ncbi:MAG TPA: YibE/F family protein [Candidatus Limnocylindrales bacterium]|nr:YibE/F family protein [Candidatus Limnocylindrales bacterium]
MRLPSRTSDEDALPAEPFAGLRRHAVPLAGAALLLVGLWLLPDLTPPPTQALPVILVHGRIVAFIPQDPEQPGPDVRVEVLGGPRDGETLEGQIQVPTTDLYQPDYAVGDEVVVNVSLEPDSEFVAVTDYWRIPALSAVLGLFALAVVVVGGWRGVRSLLALVLTLAVIVKIVVPLLLVGWEPIPLAVGAATAVTVVTLLLTEGARRSTAAAAAGTFIALALTAALAAGFTSLARFSPFQGSEDIVYLLAFQPNIDLGGLLLAAVIFGALGVLDDVTVTQAATVHELFEADTAASRWRLFGRAMNVGRSHIAATVNTLVLAYVGASLPLLVLFAAGRQDPLLVASGEVVAVEIGKAIVGSIGIVAAVPLTTAIAVLLTGRSLPFLGDGATVRRAPGWGRRSRDR